MAVIDNNPRYFFNLVAKTAAEIDPSLDPNAAAKLAGLLNPGNQEPIKPSPNNNARMSFAISNSMESLAKQPKQNQENSSKLSPTGSLVKGF